MFLWIRRFRLSAVGNIFPSVLPLINIRPHRLSDLPPVSSCLPWSLCCCRGFLGFLLGWMMFQTVWGILAVSLLSSCFLCCCCDGCSIIFLLSGPDPDLLSAPSSSITWLWMFVCRPLTMSICCSRLPPQFSGRPEGVHEERKSGSVLPGETDDSEPLVTSGDVPAQTGAEDPEISPAAAGTMHFS